MTAAREKKGKSEVAEFFFKKDNRADDQMESLISKKIKKAETYRDKM